MNIPLQWHPGFYAVLQIELKEESPGLIFENEHPLGTKPRQIDVLVIKKCRQQQLQKNIGKIFRQHNIIEYKSPADSLSIADFYRTYAYACFYQADAEGTGCVDPEELTITFVCSRFPKKLLHHLLIARGITVQFQEPGIFYLCGDPIPMQLIIVPELLPSENLWLCSLRSDIEASDAVLEDLMTDYDRNRSSNKYKSAMDLIMRANWREMEEVKEHNMCNALRELFADEFKDVIQAMEAAEARLADVNAELVNKNTEIADKDAEIADKDAEIARLKALLASLS